MLQNIIDLGGIQHSLALMGIGINGFVMINGTRNVRENITKKREELSSLEKENGEELRKYNELLKQLEEAVKESKDALNKEIGSLSDSGVTVLLDEVRRLSAFISDKLLEYLFFKDTNPLINVSILLSQVEFTPFITGIIHL